MKTSTAPAPATRLRAVAPAARMAAATSAEQIVQELDRSTPTTMFVMYVGDEELDCQISSTNYRFKPGETKEIHPRLENPREGQDNDWSGKPIKNARPDLHPKGGGLPERIVKELLIKYGQYGVIALFGDGADEQRAADARKLYITNRIERAMKKQQQWLEKCELLSRSNPNGRPPVMPKDVRVEIEWLNNHTEEVEAERPRYAAFDGGCESDDRDEVVAYVARNHAARFEAEGDSTKLIIDTRSGGDDPQEGFRRESAQAAEAELPPMDLDETPEIATPAPAWRPPGVGVLSAGTVDPTVERIVIKAMNAGIDLTDEEMNGIEARDAKIIMAVTRKINAAERK